MKLTKEDVLKIRAGASKSFALGSGLACNSARVIVQYVKRTCMPENIADYRTITDWENHILTITAISKR